MTTSTTLAEDRAMTFAEATAAVAKVRGEMEAAKRLYDVQRSRLRSLNAWYFETFRAEIKASRAALSTPSETGKASG